MQIAKSHLRHRLHKLVQLHVGDNKVLLFSLTYVMHIIDIHSKEAPYSHCQILWGLWFTGEVCGEAGLGLSPKHQTILIFRSHSMPASL